MTNPPAAISRELNTGERVIWTGKPLPPVSKWTLQRRLILVSLALSLGAIALMILFGGPGLGAWMGPIFAGGALAAVGLSFWAWSKQTELDRLSLTTYAVTPDRVLVFEDGVRAAARTLKIDGPREPFCELHNDGTVSIWLTYTLIAPEDFGPLSKPEIDRELARDGLERISDATAALDALMLARNAKVGPRGMQGLPSP